MQEHVNVKDVSPEKMREFARLMFEAFKEDMEKERMEKSA